MYIIISSFEIKMKLQFNSECIYLYDSVLEQGCMLIIFNNNNNLYKTRNSSLLVYN
jgi:hypothetical protein